MAAVNANANLPNANAPVNPVLPPPPNAGNAQNANTAAVGNHVVQPLPNINAPAILPALNAHQEALRRMGFSQDVAMYMMVNQGMDMLVKFCIMTNDEAETLCKVLHRPRGTIGKNPTPHPGFVVSVCAEMNLKLMNYLLRYGQRTLCTIAELMITLDLVRAIKLHCEWEENHKDVEPPEFSLKDWPHMIEAIKEWL